MESNSLKQAYESLAEIQKARQMLGSAGITNLLKGVESLTRPVQDAMKLHATMMSSLRPLPHGTMVSSLPGLDRHFSAIVAYQKEVEQMTMRISAPLIALSRVRHDLGSALAYTTLFDQVMPSISLSQYHQPHELVGSSYAILEFQKRLKEISRAIEKPLGLISQLESVMVPIQEKIRQQADLTRLSVTISKLHSADVFEAFNAIAIERGQLKRGVDSKLLDRLAELAANAGTVENDDDGPAIARLAEIVDEVLDGMGSLDEKMNKLVDQAEKGGSSLFRQLVLAIIVDVLMRLTCWCASEAYRFTAENVRPAEVMRSIKRLVHTDEPSNSPTCSLRIVRCRTLVVRSGRNGKSAIVGVLAAGELTQVVQRAKKWRLIRWFEPETFSYNQGWVLSKYLATY